MTTQTNPPPTLLPPPRPPGPMIVSKTIPGQPAIESLNSLRPGGHSWEPGPGGWAGGRAGNAKANIRTNMDFSLCTPHPQFWVPSKK